MPPLSFVEKTIDSTHTVGFEFYYVCFGCYVANKYLAGNIVFLVAMILTNFDSNVAFSCARIHGHIQKIPLNLP